MSRNSTNIARVRVLHHRARFADGVGLAPRILRDAAAHDDVLERVDFLRDVVFEDLEIGGGQVGDRLAVLGRKHVDADVVRFGLEGRARLVLGVPERGLRGSKRASAARTTSVAAAPVMDSLVERAGRASVYHRTFGEQRLDSRAHACDEVVAAIDADAGGLDRLADADADRDGTDDAAAPPHRVAPALDGHRHDRRAAP